MECRRISNAVVSIGAHIGEDSLKRNPYITLINCKIPGSVSAVGKIIQCKNNLLSYYGVITDRSTIAWFGVSGTGSFLKEIQIVCNAKHTNIASLFYPVAIEGERDDREEQQEENAAQGTAAETAEKSNEYPVDHTTNIVITRSEILIEGIGEVLVYSITGVYMYAIKAEIAKVEYMACTQCQNYLVINHENGVMILFDLRKKQQIYTRKTKPGRLSIFGNILQYARYILIQDKTVTLGRLADGEVLIELTFPEVVSCAAMDILQRRLITGTETGKVFQTRLDGEVPEFTESQILNNARIEGLAFSVCGTILHAIGKGTLASIAVRDGKILKTILSNSPQFIFTRITSSNIHLQ